MIYLNYVLLLIDATSLFWKLLTCLNYEIILFRTFEIKTIWDLKLNDFKIIFKVS